MKLFLDANVLLAAAGNPRGGSSKVIEQSPEIGDMLCASRLALMEAEKNIREKLVPEALERYVRMSESQ